MNPWAFIKLIFFMVRNSRRALYAAVFLGLLNGGCNTVLLVLINKALVRGGAAPSGLVLMFVGACLFLPLSRLASEILLTYLGQNTLMELRAQFSRRILAAPLRQLEELGTHRLMAVLTDDVNVMSNALLNVPVICISSAVTLACLIYLGWLSVPAFLFVLGFLCLGVATYQLAVSKAMRDLARAREQNDALLKHFRSLTEGIKELKLHEARRETFITDVLQPTAEAYRRHNIKGMIVYIASASWGQSLVFACLGLFLFLLPVFKEVSEQVMSGYVLTLLYLMIPLQAIMNILPAMGRAQVALKKVEALGLSLGREFEAAERGGGARMKGDWSRVDIMGVTHAYRHEADDSEFVLGPIDLQLRCGEVVFLIGANGSGKTTLAKLLVGLYKPQSGEIRVDGQKVTDELLEDYRSHFSVVFSDFHLFDSLLGFDHAKLDAQARAYLSKLQLDKKVRLKEGVLSTTDLSSGQRKRLALLTAYLEDRPVYLFDEWAADQDPMFKSIFYNQLLPELKARGKTVFVVTHDDNYYALADRIIKLDYGKVVYDNVPLTAAVRT